MSHKVKLIVCDVDGTLLDKDRVKPSYDVLNMINKVNASSLIFSLASGRSYNSLSMLFENNVYFICSDGAYIVNNNEVIYKSPIEKDILNIIIPKLNGTDFVLYTKNTAYATSQNTAEIIRNTENGKVKPISSYNNAEIYKIALFKSDTYVSHYIKANNLLRECYRDKYWTEYVNNNADKGNAVDFLQKKHRISFEETSVFGDGLNDIPMLKKAYYSYAVRNARPEIKLLARFYTQDILSEAMKFL